MSGDLLQFKEEPDDMTVAGGTPSLTGKAPWPVLIVDDEEAVHAMTRLVLRNIRFHGRPLQLESVYSGTEGRELLRNRQDFALILLDVVTETDDAGCNWCGSSGKPWGTMPCASSCGLASPGTPQRKR